MGSDIYDVLDKGFVRLDYFQGGDLQTVNCARISYHRQHKQIEQGDDKLISYLLKHRHGTPFEASEFLFHVKCPIFVAREWMRHRIASYNEISGRYVKLEHDFYLPEGDAIRIQTGKPGHYKMQPIYDPAKEYAVRSAMENAYAQSYDTYNRLIKMGVAKELARDVLPVGIYTEFYFKSNARSLMNFISLRNEEHALHEIREYAKVVEKIFAKCMPLSYTAFTENGRIAP